MSIQQVLEGVNSLSPVPMTEEAVYYNIINKFK